MRTLPKLASLALFLFLAHNLASAQRPTHAGSIIGLLYLRHGRPPPFVDVQVEGNSPSSINPLPTVVQGLRRPPRPTLSRRAAATAPHGRSRAARHSVRLDRAEDSVRSGREVTAPRTTRHSAPEIVLPAVWTCLR